MLVSSESPSRIVASEPQGVRSSAKEFNSTKRTDLSSKATEFESILLGQWLQGSETSFGSVPGGDEDGDAGADQMKSFAFQQLATGLAGKGGIGLAKMVGSALMKETQGARSPDQQSVLNQATTSHAAAVRTSLAQASVSRRQAPDCARLAYAELQRSGNVSMPEER